MKRFLFVFLLLVGCFGVGGVVRADYDEPDGESDNLPDDYIGPTSQQECLDVIPDCEKIAKDCGVPNDNNPFIFKNEGANYKAKCDIWTGPLTSENSWRQYENIFNHCYSIFWAQESKFIPQNSYINGLQGKPLYMAAGMGKDPVTGEIKGGTKQLTLPEACAQYPIQIVKSDTSGPKITQEEADAFYTNGVEKCQKMIDEMPYWGAPEGIKILTLKKEDFTQELMLANEDTNNAGGLIQRVKDGAKDPEKVDCEKFVTFGDKAGRVAQCKIAYNQMLPLVCKDSKSVSTNYKGGDVEGEKKSPNYSVINSKNKDLFIEDCVTQYIVQPASNLTQVIPDIFDSTNSVLDEYLDELRPDARSFLSLSKFPSTLISQTVAHLEAATDNAWYRLDVGETGKEHMAKKIDTKICSILSKYREVILSTTYGGDEIKSVQNAANVEDAQKKADCACIADGRPQQLSPVAKGNVVQINKECCAICKVGIGGAVLYRGNKSICAKPPGDFTLPGIRAFPNPVKSSITSPQQFLGNVIKIVLGIIGSIALAMVIYGGFSMMTAAGNGERVAAGQKTVVWASLGLIVIFSSYALVNFVLNSFG